MIDPVKILGSLISNGALSRGGNGQNALVSMALSSLLGGRNNNAGAAQQVIGALLSGGGNSNNNGGLLGSALGGLLGGGSPAQGRQQAPNQNDLMGMLGGLMGGAQQPSQNSQNAGGGIAGMLGGLMGGAGSNAPTADVGKLLGGLMGGGAQQGASKNMLGNILGGAVAQNSAKTAGSMSDLFGGALAKYAQAKDPSVGDTVSQFFGSEAKGKEVAEHALVLVRAMINAAKADGHIDQEESRKILGNLEALTEEEVEFIRNEMRSPLNTQAFINSVPRGMEQEVYVASLTAIEVTQPEEVQYLRQLAEGLRLSPQDVNAIHDEMQLGHLYS